MKCLACYQTLENSITEFHERCSLRIFKSKSPPILNYTYDEISELAKSVIQEKLAIPGVQKKLSLTFDSSSNLEKRLTIVGLWNGLFILKPSHDDYPELPQNEDVTMHLSKAAGIKTAEHCLIRFKTGELAYLSVRFDRIIKRKKLIKIHQEDLCQLTGLLTEDKYHSSLEKVASAVNRYTTNKGLELHELLKISIFSFLIGNSDMHLKNYSIVYKPEGTIGLSPAYDLLATKLVVPEDKEESALTIRGKKNRLRLNDFKDFAYYCNLNEKAFKNIINKFEEQLEIFKKIIESSFLSDEMAIKYLELIYQRAERLSLKVPKKYLILNR